MPGVAVIPSYPGLAAYGPSQSSGYGRADDIKHEVQQFVKQQAKGASPGNMIKSARHQYTQGKMFENQGDLQAAYSSYMKAVSLARMAMEYPKKDAMLSKEINEFFEHDGCDITERVSSVEEKLKAFEKAQSSPSPSSTDGPIVKPMGSLADRIKSLGESGMDTSLAGKRMSRSLHQSTPSVSPKVSVPSLPTPPPSLTPITPSSSISSISSLSSTSSSHTIVSPSSLGPKSSPLSTPTSSPQLDATERFHKAFPPLEEVEENSLNKLTLLSAPTAPPKSSPQPTGVNSIDAPNSPTVSSPPSFTNFTVPVDRPSSTPIPPVGNAFNNSRPASPTKPSVPYKPSSLTVGGKATGKPVIPVSTTVTIQDLKAYLTLHHVLLLDVRPRSEFEREHISKSAVCVEPHIMQESIALSHIESAMANVKSEQTLFANRDKFDLVVVYDEASTSRTPSNSPISILLKLIEDKSDRNPKILRREPMLLVGGIAAWRREAKANRPERPNSIVAPDPHRALPAAPMSPSLVSASSTSTIPSKNPFLINGYINGTSNATSPFVPPQQVTPQLQDAARQIWTPPASTSPPDTMNSLDQYPSHTRAPAETAYPSHTSQPSTNGVPALTRRPAMARPGPISYPQTRPSEPVVSPALPPTPFQYPQIAHRAPSSTPGIGSALPLNSQFDITSPPQASINSSQLSRRRSDYIDQAQEALANVHARPSIDYPELAAPQVLRPPPAAASSALERQDNRPRLQQIASPYPQPNGAQVPLPPKIASTFPAIYWSDTQIGTSGLKNMGNTCYMNAPIQCLSAAAPFARFFTEARWKHAINFTNHLGSKGILTGSFAKLLHEMWGGELPYLSPIDFRRTICTLKSQYHGSDQHDSQEFLSFLLDGIHEDLNRVICKPAPRNDTPDYEAELERLPLQEASDREWEAWRSRNDSIIVDWFQGQFRSRLECLTCNKTSTTYNVFSILQVPIPQGKSGKVPLSNCLDTFFNEEILERDDAWDCPKCKTKRRASKKLSLARLPPILLIHLKRFEAHGHFSDKIDTFVDFPMKSLDLTGYMPAAVPSQSNSQLGSFDDPHTQMPPYRYDLYAVTNHYGNLSSGHYTAYIASQGKWMSCDDSSVKQADPKQVVSQKAYVLFYKRVKA